MPEPERLVPTCFEEYVDRFYNPLRHPSRCSGCRRGPAMAQDNANAYCEPCLRYSWGYDQAEERLVRALVGAAVTAAFDSGASSQLIRQAVDAALEQQPCLELVGT